MYPNDYRQDLGYLYKTYLLDWFNSTKTTLDQYGQWNYTIIAWDTDGYNDTVKGHIKLLQIITRDYYLH